MRIAERRSAARRGAALQCSRRVPACWFDRSGVELALAAVITANVVCEAVGGDVGVCVDEGVTEWLTPSLVGGPGSNVAMCRTREHEVA